MFTDYWKSMETLVEANLHMLTSEESCDVNFRVGKNEKILHCHSYILISRSRVFHAMLRGPLAEKDDITVPDVEDDIFYKMLIFMYTDIFEPTNESVTGLLYLSIKYAVIGLERLCLSYLEHSLSSENACIILEQAFLLDKDQLFAKALQIIFENGELCLKSDEFTSISIGCLQRSVSCCGIAVEPEQIFSAAICWAEEDCRCNGREVTPTNLRLCLEQAFYFIPFVDIDLNVCVGNIVPKQLLTENEIENILEYRESSHNELCPFKRRFSRDPERTKEMSPTTEDIIFYDHHKEVTVLGDSGGGLDFTCNEDVFLHGVLLFRRRGSTEQKYHLTVQRCLSQFFIEDRTYQVTVDNGYTQPVVKVLLKQPLPIMKDVRYCVYVELSEGVGPLYVGEGESNGISAGQVTFTKETQEYVDAVNLIYGFIVGQ